MTHSVRGAKAPSEEWRKGGHWRHPHMCRDEHVEIGHADSEHEMCPLCRALSRLAEAERLLAWEHSEASHVYPHTNVFPIVFADGHSHEGWCDTCAFLAQRTQAAPSGAEAPRKP